MGSAPNTLLYLKQLHLNLPTSSFCLFHWTLERGVKCDSSSALGENLKAAFLPPWPMSRTPSQLYWTWRALVGCSTSPPPPPPPSQTSRHSPSPTLTRLCPTSSS